MGWTDTTLWGTVWLIGEWLIRLVMLVVVPFRRSPSAAGSWLLLIFFQPLIGLALYAAIGRARLPRWRREQIARLPQALADVVERLERHPNVFHPEPTAELRQAVKLTESLGRLPILGGNDAELLADYDGTIDRLVADIDAARNHVHLLFYIFADDATGRKVIDALARAARRGVKCRVLVDYLGSRHWLRTLVPKLTAAGAEVYDLLRIGRIRRRSGRVDLRNHRKIAVIDGRVGYTGSQNVVDAAFKPGIVYEDLMARVTGAVVLELQYVFVADWFLETDEILDTPDTFPDPAVTGDVPAQAMASGPGFPTWNYHRLIVALIHGARQRVVITTPYFIPDEPLMQAMETAVLRGVDVRLIVSRVEDQFLVSHAQKSYYGDLMEAGVKVHLYGKDFLHAKHLSIDGAVALIGSSNMDIRSFALNGEISLLFYDSGVAARLRAEEDRYLAGSVELELKEWRGRPFFAKLLQYLARLMSPLL